jgi:hypothetical protein
LPLDGALQTAQPKLREGLRGILFQRWVYVSTGIIRILLMLRVVLVCRKTALMHAAENNRVPIATALIDAGADLNSKTGDGCAYFHARKCCFAFPPGAREDQRLRACHCRDFSLIIALEKGHLEMAKLLLLRGADVKLQRSTGYYSRRCAPTGLPESSSLWPCRRCSNDYVVL